MTSTQVLAGVLKPCFQMADSQQASWIIRRKERFTMLRGLRQSITAHPHHAGIAAAFIIVIAMTGCMPASHLAYEQTLTTTLAPDNGRDTVIAAAFGLDSYETAPDDALVSAGMLE